MIEHLVNTALMSLNSPLFLLVAIAYAIGVKSYWLHLLTVHGIKSKPLNKPWFFLVGVLLGSLFEDIAWTIATCRLYMPEIPYAIMIFFLRIAWAMLIVQYQSLSFFIASLPEKNFKLNLFQKCCLIFSICYSGFFLFLAGFKSSIIQMLIYGISASSKSSPFEQHLIKISPFYLLPILIIPSIFTTLNKLQTSQLPNILKKQLNTLLLYLVVPYLFTEFTGAATTYFPSLAEHKYSIKSLSILIFTYLVYYSIKHVMSLRFLNFHTTVQSHEQFNTINNVKLILEQLSQATSLEELGQISKTFFKNAYHIPTTKTSLTIRSFAETNDVPLYQPYASLAHTVENFLINSQHCAKIFEKYSILVKDEIAFNNFYHQSTINAVALEFLEHLEADIFIPIYGKKTIIAYLIVGKKSRPRHLYTQTEQDEMFVFANYLGKVIHLLQQRNVTTLLQQERILTEELYHKHQEINQYKESMYTLLRNHKKHEVGILFYHNGRFTYANQAAHTLLPLNPNLYESSPLITEIKRITTHAITYQSPQQKELDAPQHQRIIVQALPHKEAGGAIISLQRSDIIDRIAQQVEELKNPSHSDYLFYLQTTRSGKLINNLLPGTSPAILNIKTSLLSMALSKKALLLEMPEADLMSTVELIHHISLHERLEIFDAKGTSTDHSYDQAKKLFGINPIFDATPQAPPLLEQLDGTGTLLIRHIDQLSREAQEHLAEYLKYGAFRILKGHQKITSDVRIICWTQQHLAARVQEGSFSNALYQELKKGTVTLPSLLSLPEQEIQEITKGFIEQESSASWETKLPDLARIVQLRPASLYELKEKVRHLLKQQPATHKEYQPATTITHDIDLLQAANLGKKALKDEKIMKLLWDKFQNQNKIATFLGVNRSSVNRRCKEYNLQ